MLETGIKGKQELVVTPELSASVAGSGFVDVYATPMLVALVEKTAALSVNDELEEGVTTVGTKVDINHTAATPIGMKVRCETELIEIDRKRFVFKFTAYDEVGEIGNGIHERFAVDQKKFQEKADNKGK